MLVREEVFAAETRRVLAGVLGCELRFGVEVARWADETGDLNETTSWRRALGEGS
jgi:hypothetical protein